MQVPHLCGFEASKQSIKNRGLLQSICLFLADIHYLPLTRNSPCSHAGATPQRIRGVQAEHPEPGPAAEHPPVPGGHVTVLALMQVPYLSGFEASKQSIKNRRLLQSIRLFLADIH